MPQGGSFPGRTTDGERLRERIISYLGNLPNVFSIGWEPHGYYSLLPICEKSTVYPMLLLIYPIVLAAGFPSLRSTVPSHAEPYLPMNPLLCQLNF